MQTQSLTLRIEMLGALQVQVDSKTAVFRTDALRILLAYLAVHQGASQRRDALAGLLSPDRPDKEALTYLRNRLTRLRRTLRDNEATPPWFVVDRKQVALRTGADIEIDVVAFERLLAEVQAHPHRRLAGCRNCLGKLETAVSLYRGDILAGLNFPSDVWEAWLLTQREHYQQQALAALALLREAQMERGDLTAVLAVTQKELAIEPWLEAAHRAQMLAHFQLGDRNAALAQFEQCQQLLWDELGVEPEAETLELQQQILDDALPTVVIATDDIPNNLPLQTTPFFGRETEKERLRQLLVDPSYRVVTLVGAGGIGKTRLSLEVGQQVKDSFPDGVWFVQLDAVKGGAEQIKIAVGEAAGLNAGQDGKQLSGEQVIAILRDKQLLIFDNSEYVLDELAFLPEWLRRAPNIAILASSREPLNFQDELVVPLVGLPLGAAEELNAAEALFVERATLARADFGATAENLPLVRDICGLVDGSPLGIGLAAAWVRRRSLAQIKASIGRSLDFLSSRMRDTDPRHRSMRAVFETSWQLLTADEQTVFAALSVFPSDFSEEAAVKIAGANLFDLDTLCDKSLLQQLHAQERYVLHGLIRQFAMEKLGETAPSTGLGQPVIDGEFIDYYYLFAARNQRNYEMLRPEWRNFSAAITKAFDLGLETAVLDLVQTLDEPWFRQARYSDMRQGLELALEAAKILQNHPVYAQMLLRLGEIEMEQNDYNLAETRLELAMTHFLHLEDSFGIANAKFFVGRIKSEKAQANEAIDLLEESKQIFEAESHDLGVVKNLNYISLCWLRQRRDLDRAEKYLIQAVNRQKTIPLSSNYIETLRFLAKVNVFKQRYSKAEAFLKQAKTLSHTLNDKGEAAAVLFEQMDLYKRLGQYELALELGHECLNSFKSVGSLRWEGLIKTQLGLLYQSLSKFDLAAHLLLDSLNIFEEMGDQYEQAWIHYYLYKLYFELSEEQLMEQNRVAARNLGFVLNDNLLQELTI